MDEGISLETKWVWQKVHGVEKVCEFLAKHNVQPGEFTLAALPGSRGHATEADFVIVYLVKGGSR